MKNFITYKEIKIIFIRYSQKYCRREVSIFDFSYIYF